MTDSTGYSPDAVEAALAPSRGQDEAIQRLLQSLEQVGREVSIACQTLDLCEDFEATAYHLRRALAHIRFCSGVLGDLRKTKT